MSSEIQYKTCSKDDCSNEKCTDDGLLPMSEFHKDGVRYRRECKSCIGKMNKKRYQKRKLKAKLVSDLNLGLELQDKQCSNKECLKILPITGFYKNGIGGYE